MSRMQNLSREIVIENQETVIKKSWNSQGKIIGKVWGNCYKQKTTYHLDVYGILVHNLSGIFLENIFKYQNDHSDMFGGAILAQ